jgi:hypothetical protein
MARRALAAASAARLVFFFGASPHFFKKVIKLLPGPRDAGGNLGGLVGLGGALGLDAVAAGDLKARQRRGKIPFEIVGKALDGPRRRVDRVDRSRHGGVAIAVTACAALWHDNDPRVVADCAGLLDLPCRGRLSAARLIFGYLGRRCRARGVVVSRPAGR